MPAQGMRPGELITRLQVAASAAPLFKALEYIEVTRLNIFNPGSDERTFKVFHSLADTPSWTDTETIVFGNLAPGGSVCLWAEEAPLLLREGESLGMSGSDTLNAAMFGLPINARGDDLVM